MILIVNKINIACKDMRNSIRGQGNAQKMISQSVEKPFYYMSLIHNFADFIVKILTSTLFPKNLE